ncbi:hypothetical protein F6X68_21535 [Micromonospora sp. AMSO12t]|uniref:hypothetical protein n=1 Tax=Micromonospora sp. AMSO12t TaxID=2650410 RepID=UPI00124B9997|nr:hypothetical protein [Micromonospora sp. AMSO12t]KAB1141590.1 hypothetical protein F6X68_21535 [Micromonospora sp. AMSO12t]
MQQRPVVIFFRASDDAPWEAKRILSKLVNLSTDGDALNFRVKAGLLMPLGSRLNSVGYSARVGGERHLERHELVTPYQVELEAKGHLFRCLEFAHRSQSFTVESMVGVSYYCLAFSSTSLDLVREAASQAGSHDVVAIAGFPADDFLCFTALWDWLLLAYIVVQGFVLEAIQETVADFGLSQEGLNDYAWSPGERPWNSPGFFSNEFEGHVLLERRLSELPLPPDLSATKLFRRKKVASPARIALRQLPGEIDKINRRDDPERPGHFELDEPLWQWPDPEQAYRKIEDYCLKVGHPERKWEGFARIGFLSHYGDGRYLAYLLCSALLCSDFTAYDMKVSADGTLEFSVNVMVACRTGEFRNIWTAWNAKPGRPIALSSAYVSPPGGRVCSKPLSPPGRISESASWDDRYAWVEGAARKYGNAVSGEGLCAVGWLWLPHDDSATKSFAAWCRRNKGQFTFKRKKYGGMVTQLNLELTFLSMEQIVASLRMAQACLGMLGVRSIVDVRYD